MRSEFLAYQLTAKVGDVTEASWETLLLSPRRFARFAARELARTLP